MTKTILAVFLAVGLAGTGVFYYLNYVGAGAEIAAKSRADRRGAPVPVIAASVQIMTVPVTIETIGTTEAFATVAVKSRVDGQVMERFFREGQMVRKGDHLFTIDPRSFRAKLHQIEAVLARDQAQLANAKADLARYTRLSQSGYSSQQKLDQVKAEATALEAAVRANMAARELAELELEFTKIVAPIDGRAGSVLIDPGNLVKANDAGPMVVINQTKPIYVAFSVPEQNLVEIKDRMTGGALKADVHVPGSRLEPERGRVVFIDNAVNQATGTILLKAELVNEREQLSPGQFVRISLVLREIENALVVPSQAIQHGQDSNYILVVQPNGTAGLRDVVVGPTWGDVTVVEQGLAMGDVVITEGHLRVRAGARVVVEGDNGESPRGATGRRGAAAPGGSKGSDGS